MQEQDKSVPPYKRNLQLTPRDLRARLKKRFSDPRKNQLDPDAYQRELDKLLEEKAMLRSSKAKDKQQARLWKELMMPLKAELKNANAMLVYKGGSPERREAIEGYVLVLNTLHDRLVIDSHKNFTPAQLGKAQHRPNNGSHWSDWIPPSVKVKVQEMFMNLPRDGTKKKIPFERKVPAVLGKKLKARLLERTTKELGVAKEKARRSAMARDMDTNEIDVERVANIERAIEWITAADDTEALPTTWSGFFKGIA
jgi:hypothetical protein